jgi:hypothetical protein
MSTKKYLLKTNRILIEICKEFRGNMFKKRMLNVEFSALSVDLTQLNCKHNHVKMFLKLRVKRTLNTRQLNIVRRYKTLF